MNKFTDYAIYIIKQFDDRQIDVNEIITESGWFDTWNLFIVDGDKTYHYFREQEQGGGVQNKEYELVPKN